jgi:hypothetical protein
MIDYRAAWMFSDKELHAAVKDAWKANPRPEFRMQLLRFIEEGPIVRCVDLARATALDEKQSQYSRMVAARALAACGDDRGLRALARQVKAAPDRLSPRLAPEFALVLFPSRMSVPDLIDLIDRSQPARQFEVEGFSRHLPTLFAAAQPRPAQKEFAFRIAELCLAESNDEDDSIASRHRELSKGVSKLAVTELSTRQEGSIEPGLIRLLRAVERAQSDSDDEEELSTIRARLKRDKALNRDLMWTNARQEVNGVPRAKLPIREFQVGPHSGRMLWSTDLSDLEWLTDDCRHLPAENVSLRQICMN